MIRSREISPGCSSLCLREDMATAAATLAAGSWAFQARLHHYSHEGSLLPPPSLALRSNGLVGVRIPLTKTIVHAHRGPSSPSPVVASAEFAHKEANKFREDLFEELGKYENLADTRGRIADTCAKVLQEYASTYSGVFTPPQPVDGMKKALQEQGLPTEKPLCCAIWWVRAHLNRDWEQWNAAKA